MKYDINLGLSNINQKKNFSKNTQAETKYHLVRKNFILKKESLLSQYNKNRSIHNHCHNYV